MGVRELISSILTCDIGGNSKNNLKDGVSTMKKFDGSKDPNVRVPTPSKGEVIVRTALSADASSLRANNPLAGALPAKTEVPKGGAVCGTVAAVGKDVTGFKEGDKVVALIVGNNTNTTYAAARADMVAVIPPGMSPFDAAKMPGAFVKARQALYTTLEIEQCSKVLILGGGCPVGVASVQIAKQKGAEVVTTAAASATGIVSGLGADKVVNENDWAKDASLKGFDAVFDAAGDSIVVTPTGTAASASGSPKASDSAAAGVSLKAKKVLKAEGRFLSIKDVKQ